MSRGGLKITRHSEDNDDLVTRSEPLSPLLTQFAKTVAPQTATDQARSRNAQSFMQQLTSIMTGKQRYATVDDAVKDMQERTGLGLYLDNIKSAKKKVNKQASDSEIYQLGLNDGKYDLEHNQVGDIVASMRHHHQVNKIKTDPFAYVEGYVEGSDYINKLKQDPIAAKPVDGRTALDYEINKLKEIISKHHSFSNWIDHLNKIHGKKEASNNQIPETLAKYDFVNDIVSYIHNNIKNTGGGTAIPALQYDLLSVFPKINPSDIMNDEVSKYISDCIYEEQKMIPADSSNNSNLGRGVGKDLLVQDSDPWAGLVPSK